MKYTILIFMITSLLIAKSSKLTSTIETGFLAAISHKVQFSKNGTYFDYTEDGGQDVLFPFLRFSLEMRANKKHTLFLLYQPLTIKTEAILDAPLKVDGELFATGTPMEFLYNFPFYRISWLRELAYKNRIWDFGIGASLQIRNATISFASKDGKQFRQNGGVGPVPALKVRARIHPTKQYWIAFEADGMYAPVSYINGSDNEVVGAILDASLQGGMKFRRSPYSTFLNLRYLGGGATGTSEKKAYGDGYVKNWLHFMTVSTGFSANF